ncbi:MAG: hypothetical protein JY451_10655 [Erythrobacter sp.]|nr:MAG: hypothetical protein JY451_10655 [Erythrobacter sp.]
MPVLTPAAVATAAPDGSALESGEWIVTEDANGARAMFGEPGTEPLLSLACSPSTRSLQLFLASGATTGEAWRLDAGGEAARIDMQPTDGQIPELVATVEQGLPIIQAMGVQGQVFTLTSPQGQPRQFPAHPGLRRVIDSCS